MKTLAEFQTSLANELPDHGFSAQLLSLWYDGKGNWQKAHAQVDNLPDTASAWVHAYLHRKEGDLTNAEYWYRKAGKQRPEVSIQEEWTELVDHFLHG
ncbi:MAG TPA: hypothetical protein VGM63_10400 [Mucilaginibacter sp.]